MMSDPKRGARRRQGDADPIAPNTTPEGREQNRRTEIVLLQDIEPAMRWLLCLLLRSRWVTTFLGALLLALIVWFFGPLLGFGITAPVRQPSLRAASRSAVILVGWLVENLIHELRARKRDKALVDGVAASRRRRTRPTPPRPRRSRCWPDG